MTTRNTTRFIDIQASKEYAMTTHTIEPVHACLVLTNAEEQYSLWPAGIEVPAGWSVAHHAESREAAIAYVESHWTDMRPASLRT
ncbi:MbtH family protein [Ralstonia syzygii subsp. celebesensis]|nr:conserved hypothetical protein, MbtH-like protein [blood disease bacterium R229]